MSYIGNTLRGLVAGALALGMSVTASLAQDKGSIVSFNGPAGEAYIGKFEKFGVYVKRLSPRLIHQLVMRSKVR